MRLFVTTLIILFCFSIVGCKARNEINDTELATATRAKNNVTAVADTLAKIPGMLPYSDILDDQVRVFDAAMGLSVEDQQELSQKFTLESNLDPAGLASNPQAEAEKSKIQTDKDLEDIKESQETNFWGWVATAGGVALWVARALNVPGVQLLTDPIIKTAFGFVTKPLEEKAAQVEKKAQHLALTVESSIVGRAAMAHLDTKLGENEEIKALISQFTGGKADSIEGLFTHVAHATAVDSSDGSHEHVKTVLAEIHNTMETEGKIPVVLGKIINTTAELVTEG